MEMHADKNNMLLPQQQTDELTAIYDDFVYVARQYESMLKTVSIQDLACYQMQEMYSDGKLDFPWKISQLTYYETHKFDDFLNEKIHTDNGKSYITLQHLNPAQNKCKQLEYVPQDFAVNIMDMQLPSEIERYVIVSPENAKIGDTEFYIDGQYKAVYTRKTNQSVFECLNDKQTQSEFRVLINLVEGLRKQHYEHNEKFNGIVLNAYAAEITSVFENNILEMIGSFAEKMQSICRRKYHIKNGKKAFEAAQQDGLIDSAEDFIGYVHIRNLMRHQWDTMDELGYFNSEDASKNSSERAKYVNSYLKLCDKTIVKRMKSYIDVLHQMQNVVAKINPARLIRNLSEGNSKFTERLKKACMQNPDVMIKAELNHALTDDKYKTLSRNIRKFLPKVEVVDDFSERKEYFVQMENDYRLRSWFLQTYHSLECRMMTYCITRGHDLKNRKAWEYLKTAGVISPREYDVWKNYATLRNMLSHNYFNQDLRRQLRDVENSYYNDINEFSRKLIEISPDLQWIEKGVYKYLHQDGKVVILDFNNRKVLSESAPLPQSSLKIRGKIDLDLLTPKKPKNSAVEKYENGAELNLTGNKISAIKLPSGVRINLEKQRVVWQENVMLHTNAENFNILQTSDSKVLTDKNFKVTEYTQKNKKQPFYAGDTILLDYRYLTSLDGSGRLKEFKFRKDDRTILQTSFRQSKDGKSAIMLNDGTQILLQNHEMTITHNGKVLDFGSRKEFVATYGTNQTMPPQILKNHNGR